MSPQHPTSCGAIAVHPLVLLNVTDHHTRRLVQRHQGAQLNGSKMVGVILGTVTPSKVELLTSFEARCDTNSSVLNVDEVVAAKERANAVTPLVEVVAWYTTGTSLGEDDKHMCTELGKCFGNDHLFTVLLDPSVARRQGDDLPIQVLERQGTAFHSVVFHVESNEAERIGVEVATAVDKQDTDQALKLSTASKKLITATTQLSKRVDIITEYLAGVARGTIPVDREILRSIETLALQLPTSRKTPEHDDDYTRALMTVYLGVTSHCNDVSRSIVADGIKKGAHNV